MAREGIEKLLDITDRSYNVHWRLILRISIKKIAPTEQFSYTVVKSSIPILICNILVSFSFSLS